MKWRGRRRSVNVEDIRGKSSAGAPRRLRLSAKSGGLGLILIVVVVLLGGDPGQLLTVLLGDLQAPGGATTPTAGSRAPSGDQDLASEFVSVVLADTESTWNALFQAGGSAYREPRLVLFTDSVQSACGFASSASGPFYCPGDSKVYLDTGFFDDLHRLGAPGDFAQAYVIAHEIGHHVQNLSGTLQQVRRLQGQGDTAEANALQVRVELQADCFAGVWAYHADAQRDLLEAGDVDEGLQAAAAIGDDRLQRNAGRRVQPESFTHGSSRQRVDWFRRGMRSGSPQDCDTFSGAI